MWRNIQHDKEIECDRCSKLIKATEFLLVEEETYIHLCKDCWIQECSNKEKQ